MSFNYETKEFEEQLNDPEFNRISTRQFIKDEVYHFILIDWYTPYNYVLLQSQECREYRLISKKEHATVAALKALPLPEGDRRGTPCYQIKTWRSMDECYAEDLMGFGDAFMRYFLTQFTVGVVYDESIAPMRRFWHHHIARTIASGKHVYYSPSIDGELTPLLTYEMFIEKVEKSTSAHFVLLSQETLITNTD